MLDVLKVIVHLSKTYILFFNQINGDHVMELNVANEVNIFKGTFNITGIKT